MNSSSFSVVTTFNMNGYNNFASKMIKSFDNFWDKNIYLSVYYEDMNQPEEKLSDRIIFYSFNNFIKDWYQFRDKFIDYEKAKPNNDNNSFYKYSAIKFAHKVYTIKHQIEKCNTDYLIWLDSDVLTFNNIDYDLLSRLINNNYYLSYLGRQHINFHSECGFLIFNLKNEYHKKFWENIYLMYDEGRLFKEKEWHDSYIFDVVRLELEKQGMKSFNISTIGIKKNYDELNVFDNSILGDYMIHFKGNRKFSLSY